MRVALAQINPTVGDFQKNAEIILDFAARAKERRCDLVVYPECALFGYWAGDLLERSSVVQSQLKTLKDLSKRIPSGISLLVGVVAQNPTKRGRPFMNAAVLLEKGKAPKYFYKELLPTYDVFDEYRHFEFGDLSKNILKIKGKTILVTICEDIWAWPNSKESVSYPENPLSRIKGKKIDCVVNLSASPFSLEKSARRMSAVVQTAKYLKAPVVYTNLVGAQDEVIFDGGSFAVDKQGKLRCESIRFEQDLNVLDLETLEGGFRNQKQSKTEILRQALVFGIREFVEKNGFRRVHLGLSGGIDSAVVACMAVDALGPGKVSGFALPSEFNSPQSLTLARDLARNLGIGFKEISIQSSYEAVTKSLNATFGGLEFGVTHENLQARIRGILLMGISNLKDSLLLTTGNKSEYATGYCTLYGDMCGGLAPIADLLKRQVYELAELYNQGHVLIPKEIIGRAPSAELRPNQKDQDTLPPYDELDPIVEKLVEHKRPAKTKNRKMGSEQNVCFGV